MASRVHVFHPKVKHYNSNGSGRDSYIGVNEGGFMAPSTSFNNDVHH